jgi:hypothetical protein
MITSRHRNPHFFFIVFQEMLVFGTFTSPFLAIGAGIA